MTYCSVSVYMTSDRQLAVIQLRAPIAKVNNSCNLTDPVCTMNMLRDDDSYNG